MRKFVDDAKLKFGVWNRERKERAEARRALQSVGQNEHGHGRFFLLHVPAAATICAAIVEWYWALLFCIEATGHVDWNYRTAFGTETAAASVWNFAFETHWPVFLGLVCATVPIVMLSMVWLPVQFSMRGAGRWRRGSVIAVGVLANILVIVSGTVVMNGNRQEQVRSAVVVEQTAAQGRAAIDARLAFEQEQLRLALSNSNPYLNQAANVGAAEWERSYVAQARATNDPRLPQLERALGAARAADERRANIERLTIERATAAPEAASAANVEDTVGRELNQFAQLVEVWRPPFVAIICCLIGIFGAWWVLALMQGLNPRDVMRSGWAPEGLRIEDMRDEEAVAPQPAVPPKQRRKVYNPETGREEVFVQPKGHWRPTGKKKKTADGHTAEEMELTPDIPPDETGFTDSRTATARVTLGGMMESAATEEVASEEKRSKANDDDRGNDEPEQIDQNEPPVDFEELAAQVEEEVNEAVAVDTAPAGSAAEESLPAEYEEAPDEPAATTSDTHQDTLQPEQREDRMLAPPSVAAE